MYFSVYMLYISEFPCFWNITCETVYLRCRSTLGIISLSPFNPMGPAGAPNRTGSQWSSRAVAPSLPLIIRLLMVRVHCHVPDPRVAAAAACTGCPTLNSSCRAAPPGNAPRRLMSFKTSTVLAVPMAPIAIALASVYLLA